jgi:dTDP-4-dehydrorhamnose 3,5-epimerase
MIDGVALKYLDTYYDKRGFFREVLRASDPIMAEGFAQWSHSHMHPGVAKAWHLHARHVDWWYVVTGRLVVALYDTREDSPTYKVLDEYILGDGPAVLRIPPLVAHGCKALSEVHMIYITSREYDGSDELRLPHDDPGIGYDWLAGAEIT